MPPNPAEPSQPEHPGAVALFVDWENLKYSLYEIGRMPDPAVLMQAVKERYGRPTLARAYADWQDYYHRKSFDQMSLYHAGIEPVYVPSRRNSFQQDRIKNSVDVKMSLDCLEVSYTSPDVHTFVLVAGDADFLHVATMLQRRGRRVVMIGVSGSTSHRLNAVIDEVVFYDTEIQHAEERKPTETPLPAPEETQPAPEEAPPAPPPAAIGRPISLETAQQRLITLVREQREQEDGRNYPPVLSWLGLQMRTRAPSFSLERHGFAKFKDFVQAAEREGLLAIQTEDLVDRVWLPEDKPAREERPTAPDAGPSDADLSQALDGMAGDQIDQMADIVLTADDIENSHRDYMAKTLLGRFLHNKGHWDPSSLPSRAAPLWSETWRSMEMDEIFRVIESALDKGVLFRTVYTDPYTGADRPALELNRAHPFVRQILAMPAAD